MTDKNTSQPSEMPAKHLPKPPYEGDEILGELYAIKAQLNREANYDVAVLLKAARVDASRSNH